ncbi:rhodanese-like domain-containing protein [Fodinicola feengrottensis]|uniref:Rhodanese domain-containing protein n=1 Tax=Fodinicola feengrottensis TaxID=435914 RepID=A0ABN2GYU1_9ACTN|nr:rhodanese-like domain-containing protein [Fodinicola feengrottensis]
MNGSAERVDVSVAHAVWLAGDAFVDVRTPDEYAHGHVPGALNIPLDDLPVRLADLPAGQLVTVCTLGNRSWRAARLLAGQGRDVLCLAGGTKAWDAAGYPVVRVSEAGMRTQPGHRRWWRIHRQG